MEMVLDIAIARLRGRYEYWNDIVERIASSTLDPEEPGNATDAMRDLCDSLNILLALSEWPECIDNSICGYDLEKIEEIVKGRRQSEGVIQERRKLYSSLLSPNQEPDKISGENENTPAAKQSKPPLRLIDLNRRPGRRAQYHWPDFAAEMARYCRASIPTNQAELERHMKEWCAENWGGEPSDSMIREWVEPTFKAVRSMENAA